MKLIKVNVGERTYPLYIGEGISKHIAEILSQHIPTFTTGLEL